MCSSQCGVPEDLRFKESEIRVGARCRRCENKSEILLRKKDPLCRECFTTYITHKFRATLGKSRVMKPNDRVLIAYSGGPSSAAMLHFMTQGQEEVARKKVRLEPMILYVEEPNFSKNVGNDIVLAAKQRIKKNIALSPYPAYKISLELVLSNTITKDMIYPIDSTSTPESYNKSLQEKFENLIKTVKTQSALEDLVLRLKMKLVSKCAELLDCPKVFVGDNASRLAVRVVSDLALGRGGQISSEMGFIDNRIENVLVIRPMREILSKEVAFYNFFHKIKFELNIEVETETNLNSSIQRLTEEFVNGLQRDFPSTVSTIFRTGDKIITNTHHENNTCVMCKSGIETYSDNKCSAMESFELHERLKKISIEERNNPEGNIENQEIKVNKLFSSEMSLSSENNSCSKDVIRKQLCYACRIIVNDMDETDCFHGSILHNPTSSTQNRTKMKEMIGSYLIDGEDES